VPQQVLADKIGNLGILMHFCADPMTHEIPNNRKPGLPGTFFHLGSHCTPLDTRSGLFDGNIEHPSRRINKLLLLRANRTDPKSHSRIAAIAIQLDAEIHAEDISLPQNHFGGGDPMNELLID